MMKKALAGFLLTLTALVAPSFGAGEDTDLQRVLSDIRRSAAGVKSLAAQFVQEKHLEMFQEVLESKGRFYYVRPDRLRWELTEPVPSGFVIEGGKGRRWHDRTGETETFKVESDPAMRLISEQLFAWARVDLDWLEKQYAMTVLQESPVVLRLTPRAERAGDYLDHLRIEFSAQGSHVRVVKMVEKGGDFTRILFRDTQFNGAIDEELF